MNRYLKNHVQDDIKKKIVILSGPRQSGKTTFCKQLSDNYIYLNHDSGSDRKVISESSWKKNAELIIFDEIHKMKKWKSWIKGVYDTEGIHPGLILTGSARLETFKKGGDSLAGRFFSYRLHPLTVKEICFELKENPRDALEKILLLGGFPEPYLSGSENEARRWRRSHVDVIIREDLLDLEYIRNIKSIEILVELLSKCVGSAVSFSSLAGDLQVTVPTVRHWLQILENLYVIFPVRPFVRNIARSILKETKYYFFDTGYVKGGTGEKLENSVACSLLKELHFIEDTTGFHCSLNYIRDKEKREVDFAAVIDDKPVLLCEVKTGGDDFSKHLFYFNERIAPVKTVQIVLNCNREKEKNGVKLMDAAGFLSEIKL